MTAPLTPADRWSCWLAWLIDNGRDLPDDGWNVQRPAWGYEYHNGRMALRCLESGVFGRNPSVIALLLDGVEQWLECIPHEVGYGPHLEVPMAVDRVSACGFRLARY